jgi:glycosyltransferase involved in cell wall biosynthesis
MGRDSKRLVDVLGPVPPPFGGVSIHILRYANLLEAQGHDVRILSYTGLTGQGGLAKALQAASQLAVLYGRYAVRRGDVLHVHYGGLGYFQAVAPLLATTAARKVATFHSVRVIQDLERAGASRRRRALDLLSRLDLFVAVRAEIGAELRKLGLEGPAITVMPAFLPPADAEADLSRLPAAVAETLTRALAAGRRQLCCGAYYLGAGYGHDDIYGVEALADAVEALDAGEGPAADFWVLVSNPPDTPERSRIDRELRERAARWRRCAMHLHYGLPMVPVLARSSGMLRPSREDGDSVAVREALAFGVPVLASDAVVRPDGVTTYPLGAGDGLATALAAFQAGLPEPDGRAAPVRGDDPARYTGFVRDVVGT